MYPVLFNANKYQVTSLTEKGRSVSSVVETHFLNTEKENTRFATN